MLLQIRRAFGERSMHKDPYENKKSCDNDKPRDSFIPFDVMFFVAEASVVEKRISAITFAL